MKFNTKTRYGLRTMLELSIHENSNEGVLLKEISKSQEVTIRYLDRIVALLKTAGLVVNVAGKKSGYRLARPAKDISIYDVYLAFEDEMAIIDCLLPGGECSRKKNCVLRGFWCDLNSDIKSRMQSVNIGTLAENYRNTDDPSKVA